MKKLAIVLAFVGCTSARAPHADLHDRLHAMLAGYEKDGFSGTVLVAKDGALVLHRGYGFANRERGIRNGTDTLFEVASLTKPFTAAAILQLEAQGKLKTSDPLERWLGPFPPGKAAATIHHLATHTGGLVPDGSDLGSGEDRDQFIAAVKAVAMESAPGGKYRYTNAGYSVLAAVIETVSGDPYATYLRRHIAPRAGLKDMYFRGETVPADRMALGYLGTADEAKHSAPPPLRWGTIGAGGMITTVADLHRWYVALRGGRVLDPPELQKMFHPWPTEGYGWHVERDASGRQMIHKGGGMREYATQMIEYPDDGVLIVWASNDLRTRWRQTLNRGIAEVVFAAGR
ncbi:MAG TPA: serine hydrolase domain-containing protein [Thermoanaerobaculia bacterium]|nr:serine hydrolase domain-containing protein [Thermoanaerobaculia bacterium]